MTQKINQTQVSEILGSHIVGKVPVTHGQISPQWGIPPLAHECHSEIRTEVTEWHKDLMEADMQFRKQMAILEQLRLQMADAELKVSELRREITRLLDARVQQATR